MAVYRVNVLQNMRGQRMMNVYYYDTTTTLSANDAVELAEAIRDNYIDSDLVLNQASVWSYAGIGLRRVDVADQPELDIAPSSGSLSGSGSAGTDLPMQVALLIRGSAFSEFPRRVRTYIGGMVEGQLSNGLFSSTVIDRAIAFIHLMDTIQVTGAELDRVAVRIGDEGSGPVVTAFNRVLAYTATEVPATQRRRRIGVGT